MLEKSIVLNDIHKPMLSGRELQRLLWFNILIFAALILCCFFEVDQPFQLYVSLTLASIMIIWGLWKIRLSEYSLLTRISIIIYALPFINCFEYLWSRDLVYQKLIWGITANSYNQDIEIVKRVAMVGTIGLLGLLTGFISAKIFRFKNIRAKHMSENRSLALPAFFLIAFLSLLFSWLTASSETIMSPLYDESVSIVSKYRLNLNAAGIVSYVLALLLFIDSYAEKRRRIRKIKFTATLLVVFMVVVWFQFIRGDRDSIGLPIALAAVYLIQKPVISASKARYKTRQLKKIFVIACLLLAIFVFAQVIGFVRGITVTSYKDILSHVTTINYFTGTWSAVLLTPLSVVGDFYHKAMNLHRGSTYWDYLLSLPPGIITNFIGLERPIESTHGPAFEMRYGLGGTHAVVVPFMNFKTYGVLLVLFLYGHIIGRIERKIQASEKTQIKLLYGSMIIFMPSWFWYGEMSVIRGLMAYFVVVLMYRVLPKKSFRLNVDKRS